MTTHGFRQVDVFADGAFTGNPLAVVHDAAGVTTDVMQAVTLWTNLSEAAFLLEPTDLAADYRVRIFEPKSELPFAGHPTLGACAAWLDAGGVPRRPGVIVQECAAGLIEIRMHGGGGVAFAAPAMIRYEPVEQADLDRAISVLGLTAGDVIASQWIDNGPGWMGLQLTDVQRVLHIEPPTQSAQHFDVGVVGLYPAGGKVAIEVRAFFNEANGSIREDPVTGSLNASIAQWLIGNGTLGTSYTARQTSGLVHVEAEVVVGGGSIWVGGRVDIRVRGTLDL